VPVIINPIQDLSIWIVVLIEININNWSYLYLLIERTSTTLNMGSGLWLYIKSGLVVLQQNLLDRQSHCDSSSGTEFFIHLIDVEW